MKQQIFGATLAELRKKNGMTQAAVAKLLNVSNRAVSKWENGIGFPEITLLPEIAAIFGVTVDYLLTGERRGITVAGNILTDVVNNIEAYPRSGTMTDITSISRSVGGCVPNICIDLAKIDKTLPLSAIGCIGEDAYGSYILSQLQRYRIDTGRVVLSPTAPTSFSTIMNPPSGERTIFHTRGANAEFHPGMVDISDLHCAMLHIGYIFLLDAFDSFDPEYGTVMARFLHDVQSRGIRTSIDVFSDLPADYPGKVIPALKYCNYVIIDEVECCGIWNLSPRYENGKLNISAIREAMERTLSCGVVDKVIVHSREAMFCLDKTGTFTTMASLELKPEEIKGGVGVGDAFCAGALYGIYQKMSDADMLSFASAAAACNMRAENAVDGMLDKNSLMTLMRTGSRKKLNII